MEVNRHELIFRPHPLRFYTSIAALLGIGLACLSLAGRHHPAWLAGAALVMMLGSALANRFATGLLALRGCELVLYQGLLDQRALAMSIVDVEIAIRQNMIGSFLDAGEVTVRYAGGEACVRVAQLRALQFELARRRSEFTEMAFL